MRHETPFQRFKRERSPALVKLMREIGVDANRETVLSLLLRHEWAAEVAKKSLLHFDSKSWTSSQSSMNFGENTSHWPGTTTGSGS